MRRAALFSLLFLMACGAPERGSVGSREDIDSVAPPALTELHAAAEPDRRSADALAVSTRVVAGALGVEVEVGSGLRACSFGQSDGPSARTRPVDSSVLSLDVDASDAHAWLYGGAALECEGETPLYAWMLLEPSVVAPKLAELDVEDAGDPMLSERDAYVVRLRASSLGTIARASIALGSSVYPGRVAALAGDEPRTAVVFDLPPEAWIRAALAREPAVLTASVDVSGVRQITETIELGLRAAVTEASSAPLD